MKILRVALGQINTIVGDIKGNSAKIIGYIKAAKALQADIIVFPELAVSGYPPEDLLLRLKFIQECNKALKKIVAATDGIIAIVGLPLLEKKNVFNAAAVIHNNKILGFYKKIHLPNYGVFDEMRYFAPGDTATVISLRPNFRIGINICEDIWHPDWPLRGQCALGRARLIINISSSPYFAQKLSLRQNLLSLRAKENKAFVFYCNLVGGQDELVFDGASMAFSPSGKLIARARQFKEDLLIVDLDSSCPDLKVNRASEKFDVENRIRNIKVPFQARNKTIPVLRRTERASTPLEEIYSALVLGLKDYCYKNSFKRVVLGLSGGIDSALVAAIVVDALGRENCFALSMPSMYSSKGTKSDAKLIAQNLGIKSWVIPINSIYKKYLEVLKPVFDDKKRDITEENIQARIRGNILMAFSNKFGSLVVTTGNKSELSVGYCTLYGDTVGGFALIKDVPKTLVYKLAEYRNELSRSKLFPETVFKRPPSAELKKNQKDQDSLPAYSILDEIVDAYIEKDKAVSEIVKKGINRNTACRVASMIDNSEYKRRQYAVGVKITPKAFGRDRRMPITNRFVE